MGCACQESIHSQDELQVLCKSKPPTRLPRTIQKSGCLRDSAALSGRLHGSTYHEARRHGTCLSRVSLHRLATLACAKDQMLMIYRLEFVIWVHSSVVRAADYRLLRSMPRTMTARLKKMLPQEPKNYFPAPVSASAKSILLVSR